MSILRYGSVLVLLLLLLLGAAWFWLLHTAPGARFVWERAEAAFAGGLSSARVSGSVAGGLEIGEFRLSLPAVDISADTVRAAVDIDLLPLSVEVNDAAVQALVVELKRTEAPEREPPALREVLEGLRLPVWLRIDDLSIADAEVILPDRKQPFVVEHASLRADWRDRIFVDRLEVRAPVGSLAASGMLELTGNQDFDLAGSATLRPALISDDDEVNMQANIAGDLDAFELEAGGEAAIGGRGPHAFTLVAEGTTAALDIESIRLAGDDVRAAGSGRVTLEPALAASAVIDLERADPSPFVERWPEDHPLYGRLDVEFEPGYLRFDETRLAVANTDAEALFAAVVDLEAGDVGADLTWQRIAWPIGAEAPDFASRTGTLRVAGTPDDWQADGTFAVTLPGLEETEIALEGQGNRTRAGLAIANAELFGGRVAGSASVAWSDARPWAVNLYATDIDLATLAPDWPGRISGLLRAAGNIDEAWLRAAVVDIDGTLRGERFTADGGVELDRGRFVAHELALGHGESRFELDGAYWSPAGIRFEMSIADIGNYVDDAAGAVSGSGRLSLDETAPFLRLDGSSESLRVGQVVVTGLEIDDRGDGDSNALQAAIRAADISFGSERLEEPRILLGASPDLQFARARARYEDLAFDVRLEGAFDSWKRPTAWRGDVMTLEVDGGEAGGVELLDAASVSVSADAVDVSRLCLAGPEDERLCVEARWAERARLDGNASLERIPVALVNRLVDTGYDFDQALSGDLRWSYVRGQGADGAGELTISPGRIVSDGRPDLFLRTGAGTLSFDVQNDRLLSGDLSLPMPGTGAIDGRFEIADIGDVRNSAIDGRLEAHLDDVTLFTVFLPDVDALDGRLRATVDIGGTLGEPRLTGAANLESGSIDYLPLGLELRDAELAVDLAEDGFVSVSGGVRAGKGRAVIEPQSFDGGERPPGVHATIRGENLTLVSVPDVSAQSNVDMSVGFDGKRLSLGGSVDVIRARVEPETLPASRQTVSDDVVIVAGELPGAAPKRAKDGLEIVGELAVSLGPDVRLRIDVATATVSGTTTFKWDGDVMPVANGRYVVSGEVQAFGILLRIDEGSVRFPNVPASNPNLRIRAEREIFGNTQVRQAGVLIDGTLARPTLTPYTDPPTTEERALTLLVTGSDFNLEEGVGAIDFGTYIAPRLYVSYGISLFGRDNVISARYDLTEGFGVRATSGQTDSGIDLIYRIER